jgi:hypothetical protein
VHLSQPAIGDSPVPERLESEPGQEGVILR